jgi:CRISPR-associated exonuclease Cas4
MEPGEDYAPISALQHLLVCERQAALIHLERAWVEDVATATGRVLHERADSPGMSERAGVRSVRGLRLVSHRLRLGGRADVVEFDCKTGEAVPVEYKRGSSAFPAADAVQVCAQALCLEEMYGGAVLEGALFLAKKKKRRPVLFNDSLRAATHAAVERLHQMLARGELPRPVFKPVCGKCSLEPVCQPLALRERARGSAHLATLLLEEECP